MSLPETAMPTLPGGANAPFEVMCAAEGRPPQPGPGLSAEQLVTAVADTPWVAELHHILVEQAQVGLFVTHKGRLLFVNAWLARLLGYEVDELVGKPALSIAAAGSHLGVLDKVNRRQVGVQGEPYDIECRHKSGRTFDARIWGYRTELDGQQVDLVTVHDISELTQAARSMERRTLLLDQAEAIAQIGSMEIDHCSGSVQLSSGMLALFGEPASDLPVHGGWLAERVPQDERLFVASIVDGMQPGEPFEFQHRIVRRDGEVRIVLHRGQVEADAHGSRSHSRVILQDITALRESERAAADLAKLDSTTFLPNRAALLEAMETAMLHAQREGHTLALITLAIDQYRLADETLGHSGGDEFLRVAGHRLSTASRHVDLLVHLGGGRFAALVQRLGEPVEAEAQRIATELIDSLAVEFQVDGTEVMATCCIGVALAPADSDVPALLLDQALSAKRQARAVGTNQVCFYAQDASQRATSRLAAEASLRHALSRDEMHLCYQPQVDLRTGRIIGLEALSRWTDGVRGPVSPAEFIPLAEETGLIIPIGEWVLRTACKDSMRWVAAGLPPVRVGVNLSMKQLQQPDVAQRIQAILLETGMDPHRLGVEVTESMLLDNVDHVTRTLFELKALGVEVALDDFGTGYSNLSHLSKLPFDVLKVDRSFVHDVTASTDDVSITRALISMAHGLRMKVLAEGVENESQLALLVASQCDIIQGYLFSKPVRAEVVEQMLAEDKRLPEKLLRRSVRKRTLLLVDDEENVIASLRRLLRREGYHILVAHSGAQGLQMLAENEVDVIVSDQRMPGMTGVEFLRRAKELYPHTVRMSLSGYTELQSITDAVNEGSVYKFLTKPWDDERLRAHIDEAFRHKETNDENRQLADELHAANDELAQVNLRLQSLLEAQGEQIDREESRSLSVREVLESIAQPVIGFDVDGLVAFVNPEAHDLFEPGGSPLGRFAQEALAPELLQVWHSAEEWHPDVTVAGLRFDVSCRAIQADGPTRGRLMVLTPRHAPTQEART